MKIIIVLIKFTILLWPQLPPLLHLSQPQEARTCLPTSILQACILQPVTSLTPLQPSPLCVHGRNNLSHTWTTPPQPTTATPISVRTLTHHLSSFRNTTNKPSESSIFHHIMSSLFIVFTLTDTSSERVWGPVPSTLLFVLSCASLYVSVCAHGILFRSVLYLPYTLFICIIFCFG